MADILTEFFSFTKPEDQASPGTWGAKYNTNLDSLDTEINTRKTDITTAQTTADDALPKVGGAMTGEIDILTAKATRVDLPSMTGTATLDFDLANAWTGTVTGTVTIDTTNVPAGTFIVGGVIKITNGGTQVTWDAVFKWEGGTAPTLSTTGTDYVAFISLDAGTSFSTVALLDVK